MIRTKNTTKHTVSTETQNREREIAIMIAAWAEEKKVLAPGEVILVEVQIKKPETVSVRIDGYHGTTDIDSKGIEDLDFTVRTFNCLSNVNLRTVGAIKQKTLDEMLKYRNFGKKCASEVFIKLRELGVTLEWDKKKLRIDD